METCERETTIDQLGFQCTDKHDRTYSLEVGSGSSDLVNDILDGDDAVLAERLLDDLENERLEGQ